MTKIIRKKLLASMLIIAMLVSFMPAMTLTVNAAEPEPYTATVNDSLPLLVSELSGLDNFSDIFLYFFQGYTQPSSGSDSAELYYFDPDFTSGGEVGYLTNIDVFPSYVMESEDETIYFKAYTAGEYTFHIRIYDYGTIDVTRKITVTVTDGDTTKPTLTAGAVNRTSNTTATVNFTSDTEGSYYYKVVEDGDVEPTIDTGGVGTTCTTSETTITNPIGLMEGAMDIYIIVKDGAGNKSSPLKVDIDSYISSDATLKTSSRVKGEAVISLGTPSATLGSETAGAVTITAAKAADTSNATTFVTLFEKNDSNATVKTVKYASSSSTAGFATDAAYANEAIADGDFFIIKVIAEDAATVNYYRINVEVTPAPNSTKAITAFNFNGLTPNVTGTVNEVAKTIALTVPYGTDVTALVPSITHTGASVSPNTGIPTNFTSPVEYTVTAADSTSVKYTVTVSVAANPAKAITAFNFNGLTPNVTGTVDEVAKTIALTVPYGTDVTSLVPTITHTGTSISPNTGIAKDFTSPVEYTVTAADSTSVKYTVTVSVAANPAKAITAFNFNGLTPNVNGTINEGAKTIALTVPYGTDVTALVPSITHTGASLSPNTGVAQDFTSPVNYTVTAADSSTQQYTVTVTVGASSNSNLSALSISGGTLSPAFVSGTTSYTASVGNAYSSITVTPIAADGNATIKVNGLAVTSGGATGEINLSVGNNIITVVVTAQDGTTSNTYTITVTRASASGGGGGSSSTTTQPSQGTTQNTVVVVNGKEQNVGKETQKMEDGKSTVTVAIDNKAVVSKIDDAIKNNITGTGNVIQVPVTDTKSEVAKVELTGDIVKKLEDSTFDVSVKRDNVEYVIPAAEFTISKVAENLGVLEKDLEDIKIEVQITKLDETVVAKYNEVAKVNGAELIFPPVSFEVVAKTIKADGSTEQVGINKFSNYVERVMEIPSSVDSSKITTGIVFNPDGTYSHVPIDIFQKNGTWYARLNSLTNSNYSVVWNPVTVKSVEKHWSKDVVNDMASRLVIFNTETFDPNKAITRADFAEYIVRALGLYREGAKHENKFSDVHANGDRTLAILIANEYGIVSGYPNGTFRPDASITREEAMAMYQRAMKVTKLTGSDTNRYQSYTDFVKVSNWATSNVKEVLAAHVFNGANKTEISPKSNLTYAEAAQAIKNLLVESKLINK